MFIDPKKAVKEGWLVGVLEENIQPNAIDISINKLFEISDNSFIFSSIKKEHRDRFEIFLQPAEIRSNNSFQTVPVWKLNKGVYDFVSSTYVEIPKGLVGWLETRSTLNRNGMIVHTGLYDSGFKGYISGAIYNFLGTAYIEESICVAQFILAESAGKDLYSGGYNTKVGELPIECRKS